MRTRPLTMAALYLWLLALLIVFWFGLVQLALEAWRLVQ